VITVRDPARADALLHDRHVVPGMERDGPAWHPYPPRTPAPTIPEFLALWYTNGEDYPAVSAVLRRAFTARALAGFAAPCAELASPRCNPAPAR
jgi:hypothetical protein